MTYNLRFLPEVEGDVISAFDWYESKASGLGEEFLRLFYEQSYDTTTNPFRYMIVHNEFRRRLLKRFPYAIYFQIIRNEVIIFGLFHCARNPDFISGKLKNRS